MACSKCSREIYNESTECIFHCEKDEWSKYKISVFWKSLKDEKVNIDGNYSYFIFPKHTLTNQNDLFELAKTFHNCKFLGKVDLSNLVLEIADFSYSEFHGDLICKATRFNKIVNFSNIKNYQNIEFRDCYFKDNVKFINSEFNKNVYFINNDIVGELKYNNCTFLGNTHMLGNNYADNVYLTNSTFKFSFVFSDSNFYIKEKIKVLDFSSVVFNELSLINCNCKRVLCNFSNTEFDAKCLCYNSEFNTLKFKESTFLSTSYVDFNNIKVRKLILNSYHNASENIFFKSINIVKKLKIKNIIYKYEKYDKLNVLNANVEIKHVTFTDKLFKNTIWGNIDNNRFKGSQKTFRCLKNLAEDSKNFMDAAAFSSLEMKKKKDDLILEMKTLNKNYEKVAYRLNILLFSIYEWVSNYGLNWLHPLLLMIYFSFLTFFLDIYYINAWHILPILGVSFLLTTLLKGTISRTICLIFRERKLNTYILWWIISLVVIVIFSLLCIDDFTARKEGVSFTKHISPFGLFKNGSENIDFSIFLEKLVILFLGYQVFIGIKKSIRSK